MESNLSLRGIVSAVSTLYVNRREYRTFLLNDERKGTFKVYVRYEDMDWSDIEDGDHFSASGFLVTEEIMIATSVDRWGRICDVCGNWHTEGYWIGENNYACSEECALHYYGGDKEAFEEDLALLDDPDTADMADTYWTSWD
jgi:hypothetical protein